ncbi:MAG: hypothetical protein Q9207_005459 [Kuettlingeria erythrocarpa]
MFSAKLTPPVRTRRFARLENMPQEILLKDAQPQKSLFSLLVQSRRLYHAVLPSLYRRISFRVTADPTKAYKADGKLLRMAQKRNPGLRHIQELELSPRDEMRRSLHEAAGYPDAERLLKAIPRGSLKYFRWLSWHEIPREVLRLLWTRQRKLTNIKLVSCKNGVDHLITELAQNPNSFHEHATALRITDVGNGVISGIVGPLLRRRKIRSLTLDFWALWSNGNRTRNPELRKIYRDGVLLDQIFAPASYLKPGLPLALEELDLSAVNLMNGVGTMLAALYTSALKILRVTSCPEAYFLFRGMSELPEDQRPRLREPQIYHEQTPGPNARLTLDIRRRQPPYDGVQRVGWFRRASLEKLCVRVSRLEMLYGPFPPVVANEFLDYGREFRAYMATVLQIPTLKTLNVTTWAVPHAHGAVRPRGPEEEA